MFVRQSTRAFIDEARTSARTSWFDLLHGYIYLRFPYFYISVGSGEHRLTKLIRPLYDVVTSIARFFSRNGTNGTGRAPALTFADTYHGKVIPLDEAKRIVTINRNVELRNLEHVIPYEAARDIVLRNPDHIAVLECPCRSAREKPCLPLDVCLIIGEPFAGFALEHHPSRARKITGAEAVAILDAEDRRGHVHHAFFKDAMLGRFYAICNCCKCCCGAMQAHRNGTPMLASSGYLAEVDQSRCVVCRTCAKYCQFDAILYKDGKKSVDPVRCMGCAVCESKCAQQAISMRRVPEKGIPLEISQRMDAASA